MSSGTEDEKKESRRRVVRQNKLPRPRRSDRRPSGCREKDQRRLFHVFIFRQIDVWRWKHIRLTLLLITTNSSFAAQDEMAGVGLGISDDLISLEVASPDVPDLTLIDLPGIARVAVKGQPENIGDQVFVD